MQRGPAGDFNYQKNTCSRQSAGKEARTGMDRPLLEYIGSDRFPNIEDGFQMGSYIYFLDLFFFSLSSKCYDYAVNSLFY